MAKRSLPMKLKNWVLWLCVVALLATEVFLFLAKSQKDAAIVQLHESQQKVAQLQSDLDQLKNSSVATLSTENARLRAENQGLTQKFAQLQNEIKQSRQQNQKLTQQVETAHNALQQQQEQLQAMQAENQQAATVTEATAEQSTSPAAQLTPASTISGKLTRPNSNGLWKMTKLPMPFRPPRTCCRIFPTWFSRFALPAAPLRSMLSVCRRLVQSPATSCRSDPLFSIFILGFCRHSPRLSVP